MDKLSTVLVGAIALAALPAFTDKSPAPADASRIANVLVSDGYDSWGEIKRTGKDKWVVENVRSRETSQRYEMLVSAHGNGILAATPI